MSDLYRFGVSLDKSLSNLSIEIKAENYQNVSEAIRDLIREKLVQKNGLWEAWLQEQLL